MLAVCSACAAFFFLTVKPPAESTAMWEGIPRIERFHTTAALLQSMQYTIRKVPSLVDVALRRRAREQGRSLNEVVVEALARDTHFDALPQLTRL